MAPNGFDNVNRCRFSKIVTGDSDTLVIARSQVHISRGCCVPTPTQRAIPPGSVNEYQQKAGE